MRFSTILTSEQAAILYDLVKEHRVAIVQKLAPGIYHGLLLSLMRIDRGGGASLRQIPLDFGRGIVTAAIVPAATYIVWPGAHDVPGPFLDRVGTLPDLRYQSLSLRPVILSRAKHPLAIVPLPPVVVPPLPVNSGRA